MLTFLPIPDRQKWGKRIYFNWLAFMLQKNCVHVTIETCYEEHDLIIRHCPYCRYQAMYIMRQYFYHFDWISMQSNVRFKPRGTSQSINPCILFVLCHLYWKIMDSLCLYFHQTTLLSLLLITVLILMNHHWVINPDVYFTFPIKSSKLSKLYRFKRGIV